MATLQHVFYGSQFCFWLDIIYKVHILLLLLYLGLVSLLGFKLLMGN